MLTESANPIVQTQFRSKCTHFNHSGETFHDIFQQRLNNSHYSRSPKIEVTGVLVPFDKVVSGRAYKFKLDSDSKEYTLSMTETLEAIAKKIEWEEVTIKGLLNFRTDVLEVEKIVLSQSSDPIKTVLPSDDPYFDAEFYQKTIARRGKLEPEPDYLAS